MACGGTPPPSPPRAVSVPAREPELESLVPPGSSSVLIARPEALLARESSRRVLTAMFPPQQLDRFAQRTGVDPRRLTELLLVDHPDGRVVLARGDMDAAFAIREAGERMAPLESSTDQPFVRRAGFLGSRRVDLAALGPHTVVWVEGTPQLAARVLALALRPSAEGPRALRAADVCELRGSVADAPLVLLGLRPLGLPARTGIGILLARQRTLVAAAYPEESAVVAVAELRGEFPPGAEENFRALARALAESDLGVMLGLRDALPSLRIETQESRVALQVELDPVLLAAGLRVLLGAELRELLGAPGPASSSAPRGYPEAATPRDGG